MLEMLILQSSGSSAGVADSSNYIFVPGSETDQVGDLLTISSNINVAGVYLYEIDDSTKGNWSPIT